MKQHNFYIYILSNKKNGTLYIGMTNDLIRRVSEHKSKIIKGFTSKYNIDKLVYYEQTNSVEGAITKEKQMKKWERSWKIKRIEENNPEWRDLYTDLFK